MRSWRACCAVSAWPPSASSRTLTTLLLRRASGNGGCCCMPACGGRMRAVLFPGNATRTSPCTWSGKTPSTGRTRSPSQLAPLPRSSRRLCYAAGWRRRRSGSAWSRRVAGSWIGCGTTRSVSTRSRSSTGCAGRCRRWHPPGGFPRRRMLCSPAGWCAYRSPRSVWRRRTAWRARCSGPGCRSAWCAAWPECRPWWGSMVCSRSVSVADARFATASVPSPGGRRCLRFPATGRGRGGCRRLRRASSTSIPSTPGCSTVRAGRWSWMRADRCLPRSPVSR